MQIRNMQKNLIYGIFEIFLWSEGFIHELSWVFARAYMIISK